MSKATYWMRDGRTLYVTTNVTPKRCNINPFWHNGNVSTHLIVIQGQGSLLQLSMLLVPSRAITRTYHSYWTGNALLYFVLRKVSSDWCTEWWAWLIFTYICVCESRRIPLGVNYCTLEYRRDKQLENKRFEIKRCRTEQVLLNSKGISWVHWLAWKLHTKNGPKSESVTLVISLICEHKI